MGKRGRNAFKKRYLLAIVRDTVARCLKLFGYRIRPYVRESRLNPGEMMAFLNFGTRRFCILYDYVQFRETFGKRDFETQAAYAMASAAHEMRHYYQVRQIFSKAPREDRATIDAWWDNHMNGKSIAEDGISIWDFYMQPMELDAELFAYLYVAKMLEVLISVRFIGKDFLSVMREEYIRRYGADGEDLELFSDDAGAAEQAE